MKEVVDYRDEHEETFVVTLPMKEVELGEIELSKVGSGLCKLQPWKNFTWKVEICSHLVMQWMILDFLRLFLVVFDLREVGENT